MDVLKDIWEFLQQDSPKANNQPPSDSDFRITNDGSIRVTDTGDNRIVQAS